MGYSAQIATTTVDEKWIWRIISKMDHRSRDMLNAIYFLIFHHALFQWLTSKGPNYSLLSKRRSTSIGKKEKRRQSLIWFMSTKENALFSVRCKVNVQTHNSRSRLRRKDAYANSVRFQYANSGENEMSFLLCFFNLDMFAGSDKLLCFPAFS